MELKTRAVIRNAERCGIHDIACQRAFIYLSLCKVTEIHFLQVQVCPAGLLHKNNGSLPQIVLIWVFRDFSSQLLAGWLSRCNCKEKVKGSPTYAM